MTTDTYYTLLAGFCDVQHSIKLNRLLLISSYFLKKKIAFCFTNMVIAEGNFYKRLLVLYIDGFGHKFQ